MKCKTDNFVPLVVPGLSSSSGTSSSSTSLPQDSSRTFSSPATERSDEPAPGNWRETNPITQNQNKRNGNRDSDDRLRDLPEWLEEFTDNLLHPHTFLRTQIRNVLRKWHQNQGIIIFILTFPKTEIAKYVCEPKLQVLFAEDALAKQYFEQKSLAT